jgi:hypothetical protein
VGHRPVRGRIGASIRRSISRRGSKLPHVKNHQEREDGGNIENRRNQEAARQGVRSAECQAHGVKGKGSVKYQSCDKVDGSAVAQDNRRDAGRKESHGREEQLPYYETPLAPVLRQDEVCSARVVLTIHPGDRHEMGKLPEKHDNIFGLGAGMAPMIALMKPPPRRVERTAPKRCQGARLGFVSE